MKVGISFVDMEGAANNFEQEIASKNFGQVKQEATELWNKELNRVRISGGTDDEKTIFYTAMYHTMIADQSGREYYERWELLNSYSGCMLGNPALSVLADAYIKGIRTYDAEKAYRYAVNTSRRFGYG